MSIRQRSFGQPYQVVRSFNLENQFSDFIVSLDKNPKDFLQYSETKRTSDPMWREIIDGALTNLFDIKPGDFKKLPALNNTQIAEFSSKVGEVLNNSIVSLHQNLVDAAKQNECADVFKYFTDTSKPKAREYLVSAVSEINPDAIEGYKGVTTNPIFAKHKRLYQAIAKIPQLPEMDFEKKKEEFKKELLTKPKNGKVNYEEGALNEVLANAFYYMFTPMIAQHLDRKAKPESIDNVRQTLASESNPALASYLKSIHNATPDENVRGAFGLELARGVGNIEGLIERRPYAGVFGREEQGLIGRLYSGQRN